MNGIAQLLWRRHASRVGYHMPLWHPGDKRHYGLGYLPDARKTRAFQIDSRAVHASAPIVDGGLVDFRWSTVIDQNNCGSCTGHGTANALYTSHNAAGVPLPSFPSPRIGYGIVREIELPSASAPLTDSGAMPSDLVAVVNKWGIAPIGTGASYPSPRGYLSDVDETNVNIKPGLLDLETAGLLLQLTPLRIDESSPDFGAQISASIQAKAAMGVGIFVDTTNFMQWDPSSGPIKTINTNDPQGGGHWLELDYIYLLDGAPIVGGENSWSKDWAAPSGAVASPFWRPGGWEMTLDCLVGVCSDCLGFPAGVIGKAAA